MGAVRILHPHHRDVAVAVEVLAGVFVLQAVVVLVERADDAPQPARRRDDEVGAVRIELRHDVEDLRVDHLRDHRVGLVAGHERADGVKRGLTAEHLAGVQVAVNPVPGLLDPLARLPIGDFENEQILAEVALADGVQPGDARVGLRDRLDVGGRLGIRVHVIEEQLGQRPGRAPRAQVADRRRARRSGRGGRGETWTN